MNNHQGGAFLVARKIFDSEIWRLKPCSWKIIWIYILGRVNHSDNGSFRRGSGFFNFADERRRVGSDISPDMIKSCFTFLKKSKMIDTKRTTRGMFVTVLNYDTYQSLHKYSTTSKTTSRPLVNHYRTTPISKNEKNEIIKKGLSAAYYAAKHEKQTESEGQREFRRLAAQIAGKKVIV